MPHVEQGEPPPKSLKGCWVPATVIAVATVLLVMLAFVLFIPKHKGWVHPRIHGFVGDASNPGSGLEGVGVRVVTSEYTNQTTITDSEGEFQLNAVSAMEYSFPGDAVKTTELLLTREGYEPLRLRVSISGADLYGGVGPPERRVDVTMNPIRK